MKGLLLIIAAAFVIATGVLVTRGAGAQEGESERRGERFIVETAERLGVSAEELTAAMTDAQFEIIDEKVAEGKLTEEQAARLKERIEEYGPLSIIGLKQRAGKYAACRTAKLVGGAAAEVLGMERAELAEAIQSGESLAELAEAQGMSVEDFKTALLDAIKAKLDGKVAEGAITQAQADRVFERVEEEIDEIVNFHGQPGKNPCRHLGNGEKPRRDALPEGSDSQ